MSEHDDRDITLVESDGASGVKWFLAGAILGAALGLLLAPQSGAKTRRDIGKRAKRLRAEAEDRLEEVSDELKTRGKQVKAAVEEWADDVADEVKDGRRKLEKTASGARDELERRLLDARARRRAAIAADGASEDDDNDG